MSEEKRLLVVACPRSGTRSLARSLLNAGVRCHHEVMGRDGSVSHFLAVDDYYYAGMHQEGRRDFEFEHIWHQVRNPLHAIPSIAKHITKRSWWHWQEKHTGVSYDETPLRRAALFWLRWNSLCNDNDPGLTYRIEDAPLDLMGKILGVEMAPLERIRHGVAVEPIGWDELEELAEPIRLLAKEYGYDG